MQSSRPSPLFGPCLSWPNGRPSQQLLSSCCDCPVLYSSVLNNLGLFPYLLYSSQLTKDCNDFDRRLLDKMPRACQACGAFYRLLLWLELHDSNDVLSQPSCRQPNTCPHLNLTPKLTLSYVYLDATMYWFLKWQPMSSWIFHNSRFQMLTYFTLAFGNIFRNFIEIIYIIFHCKIAIMRHLTFVYTSARDTITLRRLYSCTESGRNWLSTFKNTWILVFSKFGLKVPVHTFDG